MSDQFPTDPQGYLFERGQPQSARMHGKSLYPARMGGKTLYVAAQMLRLVDEGFYYFDGNKYRVESDIPGRTKLCIRDDRDKNWLNRLSVREIDIDGSRQVRYILWPGFDSVAIINAIWTDKFTLLFNYGLHSDRCCRCNRKLSNPRSQYYALGTECIELRPDLVAWVDVTYGPYVATPDASAVPSGTDELG